MANLTEREAPQGLRPALLRPHCEEGIKQELWYIEEGYEVFYLFCLLLK